MKTRSPSLLKQDAAELSSSIWKDRKRAKFLGLDPATGFCHRRLHLDGLRQRGHLATSISGHEGAGPSFAR